MSDEVYRCVNKYIDYTTGDEYFEHSKTYPRPGPARTYATRMRFVRNKGGDLKKIGNRYHMVQVTRPQYNWQGQVTNKTYDEREYDTYFEFVETWVERVKEWERV